MRGSADKLSLSQLTFVESRDKVLEPDEARWSVTLGFFEDVRFT